MNDIPAHLLRDLDRAKRAKQIVMAYPHYTDEQRSAWLDAIDGWLDCNVKAYKHATEALEEAFREHYKPNTQEKHSNMKVIGIAGYARCGKDTFVTIAKEILAKNKFRPMRVAFADTLKVEVGEMLKNYGFDLDVNTTDSEAKSKLRPLLVWWGCSRRDLSTDGLYWVDVVDKKLKQIELDYMKNGESSDSIVALVSDVRFPNEAKWIQDTWGGVVIHLKRFQLDNFTGMKVYDQAPNEEEKKQDPIVQKMANHLVEWESKKKMTTSEAVADPDLQRVVLNTLNSTKFFKLPLPITDILS